MTLFLLEAFLQFHLYHNWCIFRYCCWILNNKAYLSNQIKDTEKKNKTTVAENQAVAEQESQYEAVVSSIYDHAYKMVKFKIDAAKDMINTLRKVISRRMQEQQLSSFGSNKISNNSAFMEDD